MNSVIKFSMVGAAMALRTDTGVETQPGTPVQKSTPFTLCGVSVFSWCLGSGGDEDTDENVFETGRDTDSFREVLDDRFQPIEDGNDDDDANTTKEDVALNAEATTVEEAATAENTEAGSSSAEPFVAVESEEVQKLRVDLGQAEERRVSAEAPGKPRKIRVGKAVSKMLGNHVSTAERARRESDRISQELDDALRRSIEDSGEAVDTEDKIEVPVSPLPGAAL